MEIEEISAEGTDLIGAVYDPVQGDCDTHIRIKRDRDGRLWINGTCGCPTGLNCKHVVATLCAAMKQEPAVLHALQPRPDAPEDSSAADLPHELEEWVEGMVQSATQEIRTDAYPEAVRDRLIYLLKPQDRSPHTCVVHLARVRLKKNGTYGSQSSYPLRNLLMEKPPKFLLKVDLRIARRLDSMSTNYSSAVLEGVEGAEVLEMIVATGRCHWVSHLSPLVKPGAARTATAGWKAREDGTQFATFFADPPATSVLGVSPPAYYDASTDTIGPLEIKSPPAVAQEWLAAPRITRQQAIYLNRILEEKLPQLHLPKARALQVVDLPPNPPIPILRLHTIRLHWWEVGWSFRETGMEGTPFHVAFPSFLYHDTVLSPSETVVTVERMEEDRLVRIKRDPAAERKLLASLGKHSLAPTEMVLPPRLVHERKLSQSWTIASSEISAWVQFMREHLPVLREEGWRIEEDDSFDLRLVEPQEYYADVTPRSENEWFDVELGVSVDGNRINLLPILLRLLEGRILDLSPSRLAKLPPQDPVLVPLEDGRQLAFPAGRLRDIMSTLVELYDPQSLDDAGRLAVSRVRAAEIATMGAPDEWNWLQGSSLRELGERLRHFQGITPITPPAGLQARLRPYQLEGLTWLQFLREYNLAGILADDMGLGKTVQTLAHLLLEKEAGRLDRPCLVVAPTSLMTNWRQEAERFAPALKVLVSHGGDRKQHHENLQSYDLIITSYPLLPRDQETLQSIDYHLLILDEAQYIKNPKTRYAQIACLLKARHRLCLTGTPLENHLGELWSQFNYLLPGYLGDETRFRALFRNPIEKENNLDRRQSLARRIAPFVLRRRKDQVMRELPPKTEIVRQVELDGAQRDLYESIRLAMHTRVQEEVRNKGMARSHIVILDALLKLRQVCCDPRLVPIESARRVKESAKLALLMDLLPELVQEGRRILLFSQFTSMLKIIEVELDNAGISYVLLTGETTDRATPVQRFQNGEVPVFLISLRAGGTGLNLTAADTVIHYDPWWNPAVENQATDRAHRIGQDKKVFVYKLTTVGTVEDKITALQARKRELVEGLLSQEAPEKLAITAQDLEVLFAPLG